MSNRMSDQQMQFEHDPETWAEERIENMDPREQPHFLYEGPTYGQKFRPVQVAPQKPRVSLYILPLVIIGILLFGGLLRVSAVHFDVLRGDGPQPHSFQFSRDGGDASTQVFKPFGTNSVVINDAQGNVHIHTGGPGEVVQIITTSGGAFDHRPMPADGVAQQNSDGTIAVNTQPTDNTSLDITVPDGMNITVTDQNGSVEADGVNGTLNVQTDSAPVNLNNVSGQVTINDQSGSVTLTQAQLSGQSTIVTSSGSITFAGTLDAQGAYRFQTDSGSVDVTLPANAAFNLSANSAGTIKNEFGNTTVGSAPQPEVVISSNSGVISVNKAS